MQFNILVSYGSEQIFLPFEEASGAAFKHFRDLGIF